MLIGEILKEKRKEYQLTQEQVSEKIFVSRKGYMEHRNEIVR